MKISDYDDMRRFKDALKHITQLSFNISQFDKKYPLEYMTEQTYAEVLKVYLGYRRELSKIAEEIDEVIRDMKG